MVGGVKRGLRRWPLRERVRLGVVEIVVLEREFPEPLTPGDVLRLAADTQCFDLYRVKPLRSYLMPSGRRMVCIFEAPDAEAIRAVARAHGFPSAVVWSSTLHTV